MDLYEKYRLTRIINANGKMTSLAGAIVLPEIIESVDAAMPRFFELSELQDRAGEIIARATGAEWGCVTACTAAGITLGVAACMTGQDPGKVARLPDTTGIFSDCASERALILFPNRESAAGGGPMKVRPSDTHSSANTVFSDKKP